MPRRAPHRPVNSRDEVHRIDGLRTAEIPRLPVALRARRQVRNHRTRIRRVHKLVRRIHRTHPVRRLARQRRVEHRVRQAYLRIRSVKIGQPHDHPLDCARHMRLHHQVLLLLAVLPLARVRLARMRLRHAGSARNAVTVNARRQHQPRHSHQLRRLERGPHQDGMQLMRRIRRPRSKRSCPPREPPRQPTAPRSNRPERSPRPPSCHTPVPGSGVSGLPRETGRRAAPTPLQPPCR